MKNYNILIIGSGFFSQNIYLPILNLLFKKEQIFLYDERALLKKKTSELFGYKYLKKFSSVELKKNNIKICFLCFERTKSFVYAQKILQAKIHLFAEKPICSNYKHLRYLIQLSKKNNVLLDGSFQRLFENKVLRSKNNSDYSKPYKLDCFFNSGNFRHNKKTIIRTDEQLSLLKDDKSMDQISYLIFLNRYWHIINVVNYLTNFTNLKGNKVKFIKHDLYTFSLEILNHNIQIRIRLSSKKKIGWDEKYIIMNKKKTTFNLEAPMKFSKKSYSKTTFYLQIKNFINSIKMLKNERIVSFSKELKFIENIWKKNV
tara:strand:+ start:64 stop:1008 length:945 start_codon:yes stop_codon:yes gene_type:complete